MNENEKIVDRFYTAFQNLDYKTMQDIYADSASFTDPAFGTLFGNDVKLMWEMLSKAAKNFSLTFIPPRSIDDQTVECHWVAHYIFSRTGKPVENRIKATIKIQNGKIMEHVDEFDFWRWSRQALGVPGMLLGWTGFFHKKVSLTARQGLEKYKASRK